METDTAHVDMACPPGADDFQSLAARQSSVYSSFFHLHRRTHIRTRIIMQYQIKWNTVSCFVKGWIDSLYPFFINRKIIFSFLWLFPFIYLFLILSQSPSGAGLAICIFRSFVYWSLDTNKYKKGNLQVKHKQLKECDWCLMFYAEPADTTRQQAHKQFNTYKYLLPE